MVLFFALHAFCMSPKIIGRNIKRIRQKNRLSTADLADVAGITAQTVREMERGKWPSLRTLVAVALALETTVENLAKKAE